MQHTTFGRRTGLRVSELVLGTARFGSATTSSGVARDVLDAYADAGGTTIDTAAGYQEGRSEEVLGELLTGRREEFVVMTKYGSNSRRAMIASVEASLRRLRTDHVDVLFAHFPDGLTPVQEILEGLDHLVRSGKVLHGGLSNFPAWRVAGGVTLAEARNLAPLVGIEIEYHLADRSAERDLLPMAQAHGLGVATYSPLAGGLLTGKYRTGGTGRLTGAPSDPRREAVVDLVLAIAARTGLSPTAIALGWLRHRARNSSTALVPVVGPATPDHLRDYLIAFTTELPDEIAAELDAGSTVDLGIPHAAVAGALAAGYDGDRSLLRPSPVAVV